MMIKCINVFNFAATEICFVYIACTPVLLITTLPDACSVYRICVMPLAY